MAYLHTIKKFTIKKADNFPMNDTVLHEGHGFVRFYGVNVHECVQGVEETSRQWQLLFVHSMLYILPALTYG
jgi:hypothetical protein